MGNTLKPVLAYLGVGSNIEAEENIARALELLRARLDMVAVSPFYRSRAAGAPGQPDFTNGVFAAETRLAPRALKYELLRGLEEKQGRRRTADKNACRPIDLDIVLYGALALDEPGLTIPDPGVRRYPFVALPLLDLAPDAVLPDTGERVRDLFPGRPEDYGLEFLPGFTSKLRAFLEGPGRS